MSAAMVRCVHKSPELAWLRAAMSRRIGLFGGSFNPVHDGHWQCAESLRKSLALDQVWWLPTRENPLKSPGELPGFSKRCAAVERKIHHHPGHRVSALLGNKNFVYAIDFIKFINKRKGSNSFVWLSGSDILQELHRWKNWRELPQFCDMAFYSRPQHTLASAGTPAARLLHTRPLLIGRRVKLSSSALRSVS